MKCRSVIKLISIEKDFSCFHKTLHGSSFSLETNCIVRRFKEPNNYVFWKNRDLQMHC
jgi:hypothetical protein